MTISVIPNSTVYSTELYVSFSAADLTEIQSNTNSLASSYVIALDTNKIYLVQSDETVHDTGLQGTIPSSGGGSTSTQDVFVQPVAPSVPTGSKYIWIQTEYGTPDGFTFWFDDGT